MTKFFSATTLGFYLSSKRADYDAAGTWPNDALEITDAECEELMKCEAQGRRIIAGPDGSPGLADPPTPMHADLVAQALAETREQRQPIIGILDGLQVSALTKADTTTASAIEATKQGLRDITKIDLSACVTYEDMRQAMKAAYAAIVMSSPASIVKAFAGVIA